MIETINISASASTSATSNVSRGGVSASEVAPANPPSADNFVGSRIRVDNLQNIAFLEYRSEDGELLRQYPNPKTTQAYRQSQELADAPSARPAQTTNVRIEASDTPVASPTPAPTTVATTTGTGSSEGGSTSVVV